MLIGRFGLGALALALAGSVARQKTRPISPGHIPTDTPLFAVLLVGTIFILAGVSYLPALALGPLAEQFTS